MSIIYSYPTSQPTVDYILIGTYVADYNATKSFTVQSLVSLINAEKGNGTLTSVTISTDAFLTAIGNPNGPAIAYTIGLAATGTPSATTFLRGDNEWVVPTVTSGIGVYNSNVLLTNDLSSANFTGAGVSTSSDVNGNVTITIEGAINAVESIVAGNGIGLSGPTGNVIVSNTGVTGLLPGDGIAISTTTGGISTVSTTGQTTGTVTSVAPGSGLSLISGTTTVNPVIGLDYTGADTYITQPAAAAPLAADLIPFHSVTGDTVNKVTFGDIQASTLALVNTSITAANADAITNNTDLLPSVNKVINVITLTDAEYTAIGTGNYVAGTLYLTTATGQPQNTVNFTINTSAINATGSCGFTSSTTVNGSVVNPIAVTGSVGSGYTVATTITPTGSNCSISGGIATQTITGTIPATPTPAAVTQTLAARTISAPAAPGTVTDTLNATTTGITGTQFTTNAPRQLSGTQGNSFSTSGFGYTATADAGYVFSPGGASVNAIYDRSISYYGDNNTTGYFDPPTQLVASTYDVTYSVTQNITDNSGNGYTLLPGDSFSGTAEGVAIQVASGGPVTASVVVVPVNGSVSSQISDSITVSSVTSNQNIALTVTGTINSNVGSVRMDQNLVATGPGASSVVTAYTYNGAGGYQAGSTQTGTLNTTANFGASVSVTGSYFIVSSSNNITPTSSPLYSIPIAVVTANITVDTALTHSYSSTIAATGGGNTPPGSGGSACNYSGTQVTVYTDSSASGGLSVGQTVYQSATSMTPYSTNAATWWRTGAPGGAQLVQFNSSGTVANISSC
jgi:hypothetical protein